MDTVTPTHRLRFTNPTVRELRRLPKTAEVAFFDAHGVVEYEWPTERLTF